MEVERQEPPGPGKRGLRVGHHPRARRAEVRERCQRNELSVCEEFAVRFQAVGGGGEKGQRGSLASAVQAANSDAAADAAPTLCSGDGLR